MPLDEAHFVLSAPNNRAANTTYLIWHEKPDTNKELQLLWLPAFVPVLDHQG